MVFNLKIVSWTWEEVNLGRAVSQLPKLVSGKSKGTRKK